MPIWQHFLALLAPRVWPLEKSLGASKTKTQTLIERSNFFSIKYLEFDKRTLIIYFNELLFHLWRGVWGLASRFDRSSVKRPLMGSICNLMIGFYWRLRYVVYLGLCLAGLSMSLFQFYMQTQQFCFPNINIPMMGKHIYDVELFSYRSKLDPLYI